jgi:redox-sensitive bicupin YhaK (pirin superfamily)
MSTVPTHEPNCIASHDGLDLVIEGRPRDLGSFQVTRLLPSAKRRAIGPFVFLDHMGPVDLAPGLGFDVRPHPHIGLSTVTYGLAGENVHRDSLGSVQINRPGDLNLMTAGRGVVHSERAEPAFRAAGGRMHGVQIWLGLPVEHEDDAPSFEHHPKSTLPQIEPAVGVRGRVLLGAAFGAASPVRHASRPWLVDLELDAGARLSVPSEEPERGVMVLAGSIGIGRERIDADRLAVLASAGPAELEAFAPSRLLLLGGPPLGHRFMSWNFVSSTREKIDRAAEAWRSGDFPKIPTDADEFIPLPEIFR